MLNRRDFITATASLAIGAGASQIWHQSTRAAAHVAKVTTTTTPDPLSFKLYTTGRQGARYEGSTNLYNTEQSVVSEVNLLTGEVRRVLLPVGEAHSVFIQQSHDLITVLPQNYARAAYLDMDLKPRGLFKAPDGYVFSGHGLHLPGTDRMFCTLYPHKGASRDIKPDGLIQLYDLSKMKLVDQFSSGGILPHDMCSFSDGKRAAVAHAGHRKYLQQAPSQESAGYSTDASSLFAPKLTIFDMQTHRIVQEMPVEQKEALIHLTITHDDQIYGVLQRFIELDRNLSASADTSALSALEKSGLPYSLHEYELPGDGQGVAVPLPLIHFNPAANTTSPIFTGPDKQRRSQSVIHQAMTGTVVAVYVFSEYLVSIPPEKEASAIRSSDLGIQSPIGLCDIPGTPYFAVAGMMDDVAIVDARNMTLVQTFRTPLFRSSHLTVQAI